MKSVGEGTQEDVCFLSHQGNGREWMMGDRKVQEELLGLTAKMLEDSKRGIILEYLMNERT